MSYSPPDYWTERGKGYEQEAIDRGWWGVENKPLFDLLDTLDFRTVLEVGCGFGRVGGALLSHYPGIELTGIDVSPDMIESARKRLPGAEWIVGDLATWQSDRQWDLVVSVSVLGHIRPEDIRDVIAKMRLWARNDVVAIDWDAPGASTSFQYGHPYLMIYGKALQTMIPYGRQTVFHVKP